MTYLASAEEEGKMSKFMKKIKAIWIRTKIFKSLLNDEDDEQK